MKILHRSIVALSVTAAVATAVSGTALLGTAGRVWAEQPMNIIVFVADDMGWNDLPYFSPPYDSNAYPSTLPQPHPARGERSLIRPDLNRFAARTFAGAGGDFGQFVEPTTDGGEISYLVTPVDQSGGYAVGGAPSRPCENPRALCSDCNNCTGCCTPKPTDPNSCCIASRDVLEHFGGLASLAREGVIFPRFYANTAKCAPSRAAIMTGRYPARMGFNLNGGRLSSREVTIAEFLKQGCSGAGSDYAHQCFDGESFSRCPCHLDNLEECNAKACYRTGLIGKWHLGGVTNAPWAQGFDEYFGFVGGSRFSWDTSTLMCSRAPMYCLDNTTVCETNADCDGKLCRRHALYVGTKRSFNDCYHPSDNASAECCDRTSGIGAYMVAKRLGHTPEHGKDNRPNAKWPCNDEGPTKDANCAHLSRILRDQARNFIVRNSSRQPYFLTVGLHDVHGTVTSPLRTENHYLTTAEGGTESLRPASPINGSKRWGLMEEVDGTVGQTLALLDQVGVCEDDPTIACADDGPCRSHCVGMGRCSAGDEATSCLTDSDCGPAQGQCEPQSKHTLVLFFSDNGATKPDSGYGDPDLRGWKGNVFEGGVRVGLLARGPWNSYRCVNGTEVGDPCGRPEDPPCNPGICRWRGSNPALASVVDVFATAVEAAGYQLNDGRVDHVITRYCSTTNKPCRDDADCGAGTCRTTASSRATVDGKSFLPALKDPADVGAVRDHAYASFPSAGATVISRDGYFVDDDEEDLSAGEGVCAYEELSLSPVRRLRGGSCETCDPNPCVDGAPGCETSNPAHPDYCSSKRCRVPGKVCVSTDPGAPSFAEACDLATGATLVTSKDRCARFDPVPMPASYDDTYRALYRCQTAADCPLTDHVLSCLPNVWTMCDRCVGAAWKLKANPTPGDTVVTALFDLESNPEEEERLNFRFQDCDDSNPEVTDVNASLDDNGLRVRKVIEALSSGDAAAIDQWLSCVSSDCATPY